MKAWKDFKCNTRLVGYSSTPSHALKIKDQLSALKEANDTMLEHIPIRIESDEEEDITSTPTEIVQDSGVRKMQIRRWMIQKYGRTNNCRGCILPEI